MEVYEIELMQEQIRQQKITEAYQKGELPRGEYLCLMSDDCSKCPHCYLRDDE